MSLKERITNGIIEIACRLNDNFKPEYLIPNDFVIEFNDLTIDHLQRKGIEALLIDFDQTLGVHNGDYIHPSALKRFNELYNSDEYKGRIIILSNRAKGDKGYKELQEIFAQYDVPIIRPKIKKPHPVAYQEILAELQEEGINPENVAMVGDTLVLDIAGANKLGLKTIQTRPIEPEPQDWIRYIHRFENWLIGQYRARELVN